MVERRARVEWIWELDEGQLRCNAGEIVIVVAQDVEECGWSYCKTEEGGEEGSSALTGRTSTGSVESAVGMNENLVTEGWVPEAALQYDYENIPFRDYQAEDSPNADEVEAAASGFVEEGSDKRGTHEVISANNLPAWVLPGLRARWWSRSQKKFCDVSITTLDEENQLVYVVFLTCRDSWKAVRFRDLLRNDGRDCALQPPEEFGDSGNYHSHTNSQYQDDLVDEFTSEQDTAVDGLLGDLVGDLREVLKETDNSSSSTGAGGTTLTASSLGSIAEAEFSDDESDAGSDAPAFGSPSPAGGMAALVAA